MKKALAVLLVTLMAGSAMAQSWGLFEADRSWIGFGDGAANDWYSLWDDGVGTFNGSDLGDFNVGANYQIFNWDIKTWGANADGAALFATVYEQGNRPAEPTFSEWWTGNDSVISGTDRQWTGYVDGGSQGGDAFQMNILDGRGIGDYQVEVYIRAWGDDPEQLFDGNEGNNFVANFSVIPEPMSAGLLGLGVAMIYFLRRKVKK